MSACKRHCAAICGRIPLLVIAACLSMPGCRDVRTTWSRVAQDAPITLVIALDGIGCLVTPGCHNVTTTWSAKVRSPDGQWIAIARTQQTVEIAGEDYYTTVNLQPLGVSQAPTEILEFSHQYVRMNLKMKWLTPSHLEVVYGPSSKPWDHVDVDFQVVKIAGIEVSIRNLSNPNAEAPQ